jgi:hypothetical protein
VALAGSGWLWLALAPDDDDNANNNNDDDDAKTPTTCWYLRHSRFSPVPLPKTKRASLAWISHDGAHVTTKLPSIAVRLGMGGGRRQIQT